MVIIGDEDNMHAAKIPEHQEEGVLHKLYFKKNLKTAMNSSPIQYSN